VSKVLKKYNKCSVIGAEKHKAELYRQSFICREVRDGREAFTGRD